MPTRDVSTAIQWIQQKKIDPIYFLIGEEYYFSRRCVNHLRHAVVSGELREFNEDIFYGSDDNLEKVSESLKVLPIMADSRLVILKEAHLLSDKDWASLDEAFDHFFPTEPGEARGTQKESSTTPTTVFVVQAPQLDRRKKTIKKWMDRAVVIECQTPAESARASWIRSLAQEKGLELEREALGYLVQMGGNSLEEIDNDLEKLQLFFGGGPRTVSLGDLAQVLDRNREENIFSLSESIGKKDRTQALFLYHRLQEQGESEIALVALVARQLRLLLKVINGQELGLKGAPLAAQVGVNHYFLDQYLQQAKLWSQQQLSQALVALAAMDRQLKSSPLPGDLWFESFLLFGWSNKQGEGLA